MDLTRHWPVAWLNVRGKSVDSHSLTACATICRPKLFDFPQPHRHSLTAHSHDFAPLTLTLWLDAQAMSMASVRLLFTQAGQRTLSV